MIQDIAPHRLLNPYLPDRKPLPDSPVYCFSDQSVLLRGGMLPHVSDFENLDPQSLVYLFSLDAEEYCFLLYKEIPETMPGFSFVPVRQLREDHFFPPHLMFSVFTALHLFHWYQSSRFCGKCGKPTFPDRNERALRCDCGNLIYPRINPAVIVGVTNGDRLLVTQYNRGYQHFALVAGFTEIGETLEETVAREVMEETGLRVKNIRYYKSQPWGIADDLLAGFFCDVDGDARITMDPGELRLAEWRTREEIVLQPDHYSLTNEMMMIFKEGQTV